MFSPTNMNLNSQETGEQTIQTRSCHLRYWAEASPAAAPQENRAGGSGQAHRPFRLHAVSAGNRQDGSHAAHAGPHRHGLRCRAGLLLRRQTPPQDVHHCRAKAIASSSRTGRTPHRPAISSSAWPFPRRRRVLQAYLAEFPPARPEEGRAAHARRFRVRLRHAGRTDHSAATATTICWQRETACTSTPQSRISYRGGRSCGAQAVVITTPSADR